MYAIPRNRIQQRLFVSQMCAICLHLIQRFFTRRFFAGFFTGMIFTIIFYHNKKVIDKPKFRSDQSKFEYEKNQLSSEDINSGPTSLWNNSWDRFD